MVEKVLNIYQRINAVMNEISYIQKLDKKVNNMYKFVSHDQVTGVLHPAFAKHGIVPIPTVVSITQDGNRTVVMLSIRFVNMDVPTDQFEVSYPGYGIDTSDKGPGKAISYAYKYALLKTLCLETGDDPDFDATAKYEKEDVVAKVIETPKEAERKLATFCKDYPDEDQNMIKDYMNKYADHYGKSMGESLSDCQDRDRFLKHFNQYKKKEEEKKKELKSA